MAYVLASLKKNQPKTQGLDPLGPLRGPGYIPRATSVDGH
jgi:hypothetical protein